MIIPWTFFIADSRGIDEMNKSIVLAHRGDFVVLRGSLGLCIRVTYQYEPQWIGGTYPPDEGLVFIPPFSTRRWECKEGTEEYTGAYNVIIERVFPP